jgi:acyl dehydratase
MPDMLAHGFQVLIQTAAGAGLFPHQVDDALMGFVEQSSRFLKGVYAGDTLYSALEITELVSQRTTGVIVMRSTVHNQRGELVLDGTHKYLIRKRAV